jgi:hypothetical protein
LNVQHASLASCTTCPRAFVYHIKLFLPALSALRDRIAFSRQHASVFCFAQAYSRTCESTVQACKAYAICEYADLACSFPCSHVYPTFALLDALSILDLAKARLSISVVDPAELLGPHSALSTTPVPISLAHLGACRLHRPLLKLQPVLRACPSRESKVEQHCRILLAETLSTAAAPPLKGRILQEWPAVPL